MRVDLYPEFLEILRSAGQLIGSRRFFLWKRDSEPEPGDVSLSFKPVIAEKVVEQVFDKTACTLCPRRISYKKDQFSQVRPVEPYLLLVHNDFLGPRAGFYNKSEENALFEKMIEGVLGFQPRTAVVREILRCHFSKEDTGEQLTLDNCSSHLRHDIEQYGIKGIILFGQAASFVFKEKNELVARQNQVFEWNGVRTMVCSGPNRLVFMREKGYPKDQIDAERKKIFATLQIFRDKIIGTP